MQQLATNRTSAQQLLTSGISAIKAGDTSQAYTYLTQALQLEPRNEQAWLWLSGAVGSDAERRYCLEQVLVINPQSMAAQRGLSRVPATAAPVSPLAFQAPVRDEPVRLQPEAVPEPLVPAPPVDPIVALLGTRIPTPQVDQPAQTAAVIAGAVALSPAAAPATPTHAPVSSAGNDRTADLEFVLNSYARHLNRDQIVRQLCEQRGLNWGEANQFVAQVEMEQRSGIARRQLPFYLVLGVLTLIGGLWLSGSSGLSIYYHLQTHTVFNPRLLLASGTGIVMVLGALIGIGQNIKDLWR